MTKEKQILMVLGNIRAASEMFRMNGYRFASAEEVAKARIEQGKDAQISSTQGWTREGMIYILKTRELYITKNSPILTDSLGAWISHSHGEEVTSFNLEEALANSVKVRDMIIPVDRFGEDETMVFLFGRNAKIYGEFLGCRYDEQGVQKNVRRIEFGGFKDTTERFGVAMENRMIARQVDFNAVNDGNIISSYGHSLHCGGKVGGWGSIDGIASFGIKD